MSRARVKSKVAATRWAVLIIPLFIFGAFGFATYAIIDHLCIDYLIHQHGQDRLAIAFVVLYAIFFPLTFAPYLRILYTTQYNAGIVPWTDARTRQEEERLEREKSQEKPRSWRSMCVPMTGDDDVEVGSWNPPDQHPDSPGLEKFYSKSIFVCESDGRPKWCSECRAWKPDRASHSSELGHCVRKMDHLCPWVGGMVSETSFNFFVQFTTFGFVYCIICLAVTAYCLHQQREDGSGLNGVVVAALALSSLFAFFTFGMAATSARFIFTNTTNIDLLRKDRVHQLAILVPQGTPSTPSYSTITYPLPQTTNPAGAEVQLHPDAQRSSGITLNSRDQNAIRTFAILRTEPGENPWDLGYYRNFKSVMGHSVFEWFLPIRHSPCCNHESPESDYDMGWLIKTLVRRVGLPLEQRKSTDIAGETIRYS